MSAPEFRIEELTAERDEAEANAETAMVQRDLAMARLAELSDIVMGLLDLHVSDEVSLETRRRAIELLSHTEPALQRATPTCTCIGSLTGNHFGDCPCAVLRPPTPEGDERAGE